MLPPVVLEPPSKARQDEFLSLVEKSVRLHGPWISPPSTPTAYLAYLDRCQADNFQGFFVCDGVDGSLSGVVNFSEIVRGCFENAYGGFYGFAPTARRGLMRAGLTRALDLAFTELALHRVEANVQPGNARSLSMIRALGFRNEGYSPSYLKIRGKWRDHERWALLAEEWNRRW